MGDDGDLAHRFDAARLRERPHIAASAAARQVDGDETRLEIRGHERERASCAEAREAPRREHERRGAGDEGSAVHQPLIRRPRLLWSP
jgi:hypothetical protein